MSSASGPVDANHPLTNGRCRAAEVVRWSLRLFGSVDLLAAIAVVLPAKALHAGHELCGLGEFPEGPLPLYLARSTSLLYAFHGAVLWCLSRDVLRFGPVIRFIAAGTIVLGGALLAVDLSAGMPTWWTLLEGPLVIATGVWLIVWTSRLGIWRIGNSE